MLGIVTEEQSFFFVCQFCAFAHKIVRHLIGDGGNGARIVRSPHQFLHTHFVSSFLDCFDGRREGIELVVEEPCDTTALDVDILMASQPDLRHPVGTCHHAEVPDGNFQFGTFLNHLFHLTNLYITISQFDTKNNIMLFHMSEHLHHLVIQELNVQSCSRNLKSFKPLLN